MTCKQAGKALFRILLTVVQPPPPHLQTATVTSIPGPRWSSRSLCSFLLIWSISSLGQDKLELELMLKESYEDTQTLSLDTAFTSSFHYMRGQDTELNGYLRVSLYSPLPPPLGSSMTFPLPRPGLLCSGNSSRGWDDYTGSIF